MKTIGIIFLVISYTAITPIRSTFDFYISVSYWFGICPIRYVVPWLEIIPYCCFVIEHNDVLDGGDLRKSNENFLFGA